MFKQLDNWHKTKTGYLVFGVVELIVAYIFVSLAIDRGNLWYYLLTLIFFVGTLRNFTALFGLVFRPKLRQRSPLMRTQRVGGRVVITQGDAALILKPSAIDLRKEWHVPGGLRDDTSEQLEITACREVREETGIIVDPDIITLAHFGEWDAIDHGDEIHVTSLFFTVKLGQRPEVTTSLEHDTYHWVTIDELNGYDVATEAKEAILKVLSVGGGSE